MLHQMLITNELSLNQTIVNYTIDRLGNNVTVGDVIVFSRSNTSQLIIGTVISLEPIYGFPTVEELLTLSQQTCRTENFIRIIQ